MKSGVSICFVDKPVHQVSGLSTSARRPSHSGRGSGTVLEVQNLSSPTVSTDFPFVDKRCLLKQELPHYPDDERLIAKVEIVRSIG